ncbi:MAG: hypothetical protein V2J16_09795 [Thermoleophilia bacterium]|jgi:hypothetical protein|nr:hypothetical protein [Thermoleophilia bacterium]
MSQDERNETPRGDQPDEAATQVGPGDGEAPGDDATRVESGGGREPGEEATRVESGAGREPDGEATRVAPGPGATPGDAAEPTGDVAVTSVAPPEEPPTRVLPGEAATRVLDTSPAPGMPPPVGREVFTSPAEPAAGGGWRPPRVLWFALIGIAVGLGLAVTFALLTRGPDLEPFIGTWGPTADSLGPLGGLVIEDQGDAAAVTVYSAEVEAIATVAAAWEDDDLVVTFADAGPLVDGGGSATLRLAYREADDHLVATLESAGGTAVQRLARVSSLGPGPAETSPAPAPTATPTQTPTATPTATGSPGSGPTPTASPDDQVRAAITRLQVGVLSWAADHGGLFPPVNAVTAAGEVGAYVDPWPTNPFTGAPMQPGSAAGDYTYEQLDAGQTYRLTGYLSDGVTVVVP